MQYVRPKVIAHRGGRKWAPENTLAAFSASVEAGMDGIELDVQRCASGEIVVIHDADVGRTTNGVGLVKDITFPELRRLSAGAWFDEDFAGERVPLLEEVLELAAGKLTVHVEIKNTPYEYPGIEDDVLAIIGPYKHKDKVVISSFDHNVLRRIHAKDKEIELAVLAGALLVDIGNYAKALGAKYWHPSLDCLLASGVEDAHRAGLAVNAWTVNSPQLWSMALTWQVDGIITDDPAGLFDFLKRIEAVRSGSS